MITVDRFTTSVELMCRKAVRTMEKTYQVLDHVEELPIAVIRELYRGYWVYLVNVCFSETHKILSGVPVIIGKTPFDGVDDGIYEAFKDNKYGSRADLSLLPNDGFISALSESWKQETH